MYLIEKSIKNLLKSKGRNISKKLSFFLMLIVFAVGILLGFQQTQPPSPPSKSDTDYPAYQRMLANLEAMTTRSHTSGSPQLEAVRLYLLAQIRDMGVEATIESSTYTVEEIKADWLAREASRNGKNQADPRSIEKIIRFIGDFNKNDEVELKNILVKLDAADTDRGILMLSHYDSTKYAPGAADDMISVCAMLEAMREQAGNAGLKNDLYFLFTDGEELGLLGAKAFVKSHPEFQSSINLIINIDTRGDRGGLLMYETSTNNYNLIRYFKSANSRPLAFSYTAALYHKMPNSSDLTNFLNAGYPGLNFAVAEGIENYHTPSDTFENLDRGTAYNFLQTALEMADNAARVQFQDISSNQDGVYFPFLPGHLVVMSNVSAYILSGFVVLSGLFWLVLQIRFGRIRLRQIAIGTGWLLGTMVVMALLSWGIVSLLTQMMKLSSLKNTETVFTSLTLVLAASTLALSIFRMRKLSLCEALAGLLPLQLLLIIGTSVFFNSISYLFTLSTLGLMIIAILERNNIGRLIASTVLGVGILLLYVPTCWLIYVMFLLPITPVVMALSVIPVSIIAAFFAAKYTLPQDKTNKMGCGYPE